MRGLAWALLLLFVFAIPWEYSLDLGPPFGNVARITGLILLAAAVPAALSSGWIGRFGWVHWLTLALYLWLCSTCFWTITPEATLIKLRAYPQEMMILWLAWEFVESPDDLRSIMRAWLAGSWVLALLTVANFASVYPDSAEQYRFAASGQDPNDVARYIDLGFPIAALLLDGKEKWQGKLLAAGYFPLGLVGVLLTASRGGAVAAIVALAGCSFLLLRRSLRNFLAGGLGVAAVAVATWFIAPEGTFERIASIDDQLRSGDLNQRLNIWNAGWHAFLESPLWGHGAGSFVAAARLAPIDTAHNTLLAILVEGGMVGLALATAVTLLSIHSIFALRSARRPALMTLMAVWLILSVAGNVGEGRTTWLLLAIIAVAHRFETEHAEQLQCNFPDPDGSADMLAAEHAL